MLALVFRNGGSQSPDWWLKTVRNNHLGDGVVFKADFDKTGVNKNELIVGGTGCGKSFSVVYPRLLHTNESSVVVPLVKGVIKEKFRDMFIEKGYEVIDLNFASPESSEYGYDPLAFIKSEMDIANLSKRIVNPRDDLKALDRYWDDCSASMIGAVIALVWLRAKRCNIQPCFCEVINILQQAEVMGGRGDNTLSFSIGKLFAEENKINPGNYASRLYNSVARLPEKTAATVLSSVNSLIDKFCSKSAMKMFENEKQVSFSSLGKKKTAMFITTSPIDNGLWNITNLMYEDLFKDLFETAEHSPDFRLPVPVHIICDDFACGSRINDFENHISIFRAAGISVTLLLQSESQLLTMYNESAAVTIINNCDTYVYLGGNDVRTCKSIAERINMPLHKILSLPLGEVLIFRRGMNPQRAHRYKTLDDPLFIKMMDRKDKDTMEIAHY